MPCRIGKGHAFPMREFPHPRLPEGRAVYPRDVDRMARLLRVELHQARRSQRSRERAIGRMIPAARANARGVTKAALHFVGERDRGDQLLPIRTHALGYCQRGGDVIARVRRFLGKIRVVVIEIANATAGRESGPVRRRLMIGTDDGGAVFGREVGSDVARDHARLLVPGAERAAEGIDHPPFHLVHHFGREIFVV